jgi:tRNA dimethylallyltransferase
MFDAGLVEEVRHILSLGFPATVKPFESHGYKQALQLIHGELNRREAVFYAQRNTRQYAKRQITWFRRESELVWLTGFGESPEIYEAARGRITSFLEG